MPFHTLTFTKRHTSTHLRKYLSHPRTLKRQPLTNMVSIQRRIWKLWSQESKTRLLSHWSIHQTSRLARSLRVQIEPSKMSLKSHRVVSAMINKSGESRITTEVMEVPSSRQEIPVSSMGPQMTVRVKTSKRRSKSLGSIVLWKGRTSAWTIKNTRLLNIVRLRTNSELLSK